MALLLGRAAAGWCAAAGGNNAAWHAILSSVNLTPDTGAPVILPSESGGMEPADVARRLMQGCYVILEGQSKAAESLGFHAGPKRVTVRSLVDRHDPKVEVVWEQAVETPVFEAPREATVYAHERRTGAPLVAGMRRSTGAVLWIAAGPGPTGRERFPYLLQALRDLGLEPPLTSKRLWVFLDTSYRMRVDPDYMAKLWRKNGIAALHIAAWHYFETGEQRDAYLRRLIGACHRNAILVYAWLELPHVSERFWEAHPEWREKTALGADAHLDWRKLMNLKNPDCAGAVKQGVEDLLRRFDWDGVNLAELYFESLEGHANPSRFTPMNPDVRKEFRETAGFDPADLFRPDSGRHGAKNSAGLKQFLEYRVELAARIEREWMAEIGRMRKELPHLDLVLTHVDNLLDPETRDRIGADARRVLPLLDKQDFTFLVEDPATAWNMGPERYPKLAAGYAPLVKKPGSLAIDINVVERYQDVYPTRQQTGVELLRELHLASRSFPRVALYFESSLRKTDWPLVGPAATAVKALRREERGTSVDLAASGGLRWRGPAKVDGAPWPVVSQGTVWLPAGEHVVEAGGEDPAIQLLDLNAELKSARVEGTVLELAYESATRALAILNRIPRRLQVDGREVEPVIWVFGEGWVLVLPPGQHVVTVITDSGV